MQWIKFNIKTRQQIILQGEFLKLLKIKLKIIQQFGKYGYLISFKLYGSTWKRRNECEIVYPYQYVYMFEDVINLFSL